MQPPHPRAFPCSSEGEEARGELRSYVLSLCLNALYDRTASGGRVQRIEYVTVSVSQFANCLTPSILCCSAHDLVASRLSSRRQWHETLPIKHSIPCRSLEPTRHQVDLLDRRASHYGYPQPVSYPFRVLSIAPLPPSHTENLILTFSKDRS